MRSLLYILILLFGFTSLAEAQTCYCVIPCPVATTLTCVKVCACPTPSPGNRAATYYVKAGKLYDPCGEQVILRGVNQLAQYIDEAGASMPEIAKTGANAVRIFWYITRGQGVAGMEPAIKAALANHLLPII